MLLPPSLSALLGPFTPAAVPDTADLLDATWQVDAAIDHVLKLLDPDPAGLADGSFTGPTGTTLMLAAPDRHTPGLYLRLPDGGTTPTTTAPVATVALPLAGTLHLAAYRHRVDAVRGRPQYLRTLDPGQLAVIHTGATTSLTGSADSAQLIVAHQPPAHRGSLPLTVADCRRAGEHARACLTTPPEQHDSYLRTQGHWLGDIPALHPTDLDRFHHQSAPALTRLAADRPLMNRLVETLRFDPERFEASRTTPLTDRLVLHAAEQRGFEIRLNTSFRPDNQRVPHDHAHPLTTRVLTGGYVQHVYRRTDRGTGPFTSRDLAPAVTTTELPGSTYSLAPALVHQAVMLPGSTTLQLRGPRTRTATAASDLVLSPIHRPAPDDGEPLLHSRPLTDAEHETLREHLVGQGLLSGRPRAHL
ncbi:hypothetical protein ACFWOG_28855 [Kitasatospora sp. NPDC058406]|uniref:hypothetical protein n=1 Tax=Kitasatospora sp. NPDC058406 TaxID=3346483 RepID=UPI003667D47E